MWGLLLAVAVAGSACSSGTSRLEVPEGERPVAAIDGPDALAVGSLIELSAARSRDPLGAILYYEWRVISRPAHGNAQLATPDQKITTLVVDVPGVYEVQLVVTAQGRRSTPARWSRTVAGEPGPTPTPNGRPTAVITGPTEVGPGVEVELSAASSLSPNGDALFYQWGLEMAPPPAGGSVFETSSTLRFVPSTEGTYVISLQVTSGGGSHRAVHTVTVSEAPTPGTADIRVLDFRPVDAEFSVAEGLMVFAATSPSSVQMVDAQSGAVARTIMLPAVPTAISVGPAGRFAAVGHDGAVSYVDLETGVVVKTIPVSCDVVDVVLADNGWLYAFPRRDQWETIRSIEIATGAETLSSGASIRAGTLVRLHPSGGAIYGADNGLSPSDIEHYDISSGAVSRIWDSPYHGDYPMCGDLWFAGDRLVTRCGTVLRTSADRESDMRYAGSLPARNYLHMDYAEATDRLYAVHDNSAFGTSAPDAGRTIHVFEGDFLQALSGIPVPRFPGPGARSFVGRARWVFANAAGDRLQVVVQADEGSGAARDFGVWSVQP